MSLAERVPGEASISLAALLSGAHLGLSGRTSLTLAGYTDEILRSGFPGLRKLNGRALRLQLDSYLQRVVDRDFRELGHTPRNPDGLRRWMSTYAAATATVATFERIREASTAGSETPPARSTVLPYRGILQRLFLLDEVPGWQPSRNQLGQLGAPSQTPSRGPGTRCAAAERHRPGPPRRRVSRSSSLARRHPPRSTVRVARNPFGPRLRTSR